MMAPRLTRPTTTGPADSGQRGVAGRLSLCGGRPGVVVLGLLRSFSAVSSLFSRPGKRPGGYSTRMSSRRSDRKSGPPGDSSGTATPQS